MSTSTQRWMMRDKVTIAYRGAAYELGSGKDYYGLWPADASRPEPLERWPRTTDGWIAAWTRFASVETPGTITAAGRGGRSSRRHAGDATAAAVVTDSATAVLPWAPEAESPGPVTEEPPPEAAHEAHEAHEVHEAHQAHEVHEAPPPVEPALGGTFAQPIVTARDRPRMPALAAPALLTAGVILGVVGLFPGYYQGTSVASQPPLLVTHVVYLAGWTIAAVLVALGGVRKRAGALLAIGLSVVTIGLLLADLFNATTAHVSLGPGTWLGLTGWLLCTAGGALALRSSGSPGWLSRPRGLDLARVAVLGLAAIGAAVTFAPSWDSYLLRFANGQTTTVTLGNAFDNPGLVIAANVVVMVLFALVVVAASLWRPIYLGAMLLAGALLPMAAQAVSALVQVSEPTSPAQFGISQSQAALAGLTITNGVTPWFWVFSMLIVILIASFAWMLITPHAATPAAPATAPAPASAPAPAVLPAAEAGWEDDTED